MKLVGDILRSARLRQGLDLDVIAREMRISRYYLEAIEQDEVSRLPGTFFYRSFVRQYGGLLKVDEAELGRALEAMQARLDSVEAAAPPDLRQQINVPPLPSPRVRKRRQAYRRWAASAALLVGAIFGCALIYQAWQKQMFAPPWTRQTAVQGEAPKPQPKLPAPVEAGSMPAEAPRAEQVQPVRTEPPGEPASPVSISSLDGTPGATRIDVAATEPTWIQIKTEGRVVFVGLLRPNESKNLALGSQASVLVGNAGGIEVSINGKPIGPIGPRGQVRVLQINSEGFQVAAPAPRKPEI